MKIGLLVAAFVLAASLPVHVRADPAPVQIVYATQSGQPAYDSDPFGGNPFASAMIAALTDRGNDAGDVLIEHTLENSGNLQAPEVESLGATSSLKVADDEAAVALVVVFADYGSEQGLISLPGAAFDAMRVGAALGEAGYDTETVVARDTAGFRAALTEFAERSADADRALIYTTAHGSEISGKVVILPPEMDTDAIPSLNGFLILLDEAALALRAHGSNRLFYAGCRDNPLGLRWEGEELIQPRAN